MMSNKSTTICVTRVGPRARRGFLMPIALVAMATLTLAITIFAEQMWAEYRATRALSGQFQAIAGAQSGVEYARVKVLAARAGQPLTKDAFELQYLTQQRDSGFWIAPERTENNGDMQYGLLNESAKLNVNGLALDLANAETSRERLMRLPGMTAQIADAILDWIDPDDSARNSGAERNWYLSARASRLPPGRPFPELSELLAVRGVTQELLFGEDTNGNGWLDECEDDGAITPPLDNADGHLERGWSEFLTVVGAESNYRDSQRMKIHLNDNNLVNLYDQLLPELGPTATTFIVALRLDGPRQQGDAQRDSADDERAERLRTSQQRLKDQLERNSTSGQARRAQSRGGLDLSAQPSFVIGSMADLINCEVLTIINGQQELVKSPWDISQVETAIARLERVCTTQPGQQLMQRINVLQASEIVLRTIPGIDANKAKAIVAGRQNARRRESIGWLVRDGLLSLEQLRLTAPYMTTGGDVWSGNSIGTALETPSLVSIHFVLDASLPVPRLLQAHESSPFTLPKRPQL